MQTDKKEDRNPFFFRKSLMTVLLHLPEGRMCLRQPAGCHHAVLSPYSPTPYYIYTPFNSPQRQIPEGGKRLPLSKVSDYFANSNARVRTKQLSLPKEFYRKTYNGK